LPFGVGAGKFNLLYNQKQQALDAFYTAPVKTNIPHTCNLITSKPKTLHPSLAAATSALLIDVC